MNRTKFCVGEPAIIQSVLRPELTGTITEVIKIGEVYEGIQTYYVDVHPHWCYETSLRKIPPEDRTSWDELKNKLKSTEYA